MKIHFSNQGNLRNFQNFVRKLDLSNPEKLEITTHDRWVTTHPVHLVFAAALALKIGKDNSEMIGEVPDSGRYLDRMGLYKFLKTKTPFSYDEKEPAGRFVPLTVIRDNDELSRFVAEMTPLLHLSEENSRIIRYIMFELIRNTLEHSFSEHGAIVAAQYYKKTNRISLGICDTGIGIWKSMQENWHPKTDLDALRLAMMPGITGTTRKEGGTPDNAGAGLFFIKSIAKITRNFFVIYSGKAEYTLLRHRERLKKGPRLYADPMRDPNTCTNDAPDFYGTLVGIDISLDETKEFKALLDEIDKVYNDSIRERKRAKYAEPKFI